MSNGNQQRCCLLGVCCPPGSAAQRASLKTWLLEKLAEIGRDDFDETKDEDRVDAWLDELPWKKEE
jgi:hypothetical protein